MAFTSITVVNTYHDSKGHPLGGYVEFTLSGPMVDATDNVTVEPTPIIGLVSAGELSQALLATDDATTQPTGMTYVVAEHINGVPARAPYNITVPYASPGGVLDLSTVTPVVPGSPVWTPVVDLLPLTGTAGAPTSGNWLRGQQALDSTNRVWLCTVSGTPGTWVTDSDAAYAPLASPALTGTPTAPTASALTDNTQVATTGYADAAVGVETSRAEGVEATNATAIASEVTRATTAEAELDTDLVEETTRASAAESANAASITTETTRATAAELARWKTVGTWVTGTAYAVNDVIDGPAGFVGGIYRCITAHTSGASFSGPGVNWEVVRDPSGSYAPDQTTRGLLQAVASRPNNLYSGVSSALGTGSCYRTKHLALADITSLSLLYANSYGTSAGPQGDGPATISVTCSVEIGGSISATGRISRGWFAGSRTVTLAPGGIARTDPIPVQIPKGRAFYIYTFVSSSGNWPLGLFLNFAASQGFDTVGDGQTANSGEGYNGASGTDQTATGFIPTSGNRVVTAYSPLAILGTTTDGRLPCVIDVGDSIANYTNDYADTGYLWRALNNTIPYLKATQGGETAQQFAADSSSFSLVEHRYQVLRYGTHAVCDYGVNDLYSSNRTVAQLQADLITIWNTLAGLSMSTWQTTIVPKTTSTDGFATVANQTSVSSGANTNRVTVNQWLRVGAPMQNGAAVAVGTAGALLAGQTGHPLVGVLDFAGAVESAQDSGFWKVTGRAVSDGAITSGQPTLTSATANFTAADKGKMVVVLGAGSAGAVLITRIIAFVNSTTVTLGGNASTTVSGAQTVIDGPTADGLHPSPGLHQGALTALVPVGQFTVVA